VGQLRFSMAGNGLELSLRAGAENPWPGWWRVGDL